jgi:prephenate dehydrogenase/cyclohexadieny/prephenate dehydrogenase
MKYLVSKDKKKRIKFSKFEKNSIIRKALISKKLKKNINSLNSSKVYIKHTRNEFNNRCVITGRSKSVYSFLKITRQTHLSKLKLFWKKLGSKVIVMNSKQHDIIFSITSHLPHLIAYNLVKTAMDFEKKKKLNFIKYSAGGLRDFSRIAASNEVMWRDVFFSNQKNIISAINLFIKNLKSFKKDIGIKDNNKIIQKLINAKRVRKKIILLKQDIDKPDFGR